MKKTLSRLGSVVACSALLVLPAAAQGDPPATETPTAGQHGGSPGGTGATDQQGSTHTDQIAEEDERERPRRDAADERPRTPATTGTAGAAERGGDKDRATLDDRTFIERAAAGSMAEVRFGHLAADKASSDRVKRFAQQMVEDHAKINEELMEVARALQVPEPHTLRAEDQKEHERLSELSGVAFDRAFVAFMLEDHRKDLAMFRQHATSANDPKVKRFAESQLPVLEAHYERAKRLQQMVDDRQTGGTSGVTTGTSGSPDRVYAGEDDQQRSETHVHDDEQEGAEEQPGTSSGVPPQ